MDDLKMRNSERARVWWPIRMRTDAGEFFAVTFDGSANGVLLLAARPVAVDTRVTLLAEVPGTPPRTVTAKGRVAHSGVNKDDPDGLWPHRIGIALDDVETEFRTALEKLEETARILPR